MFERNPRRIEMGKLVMEATSKEMENFTGGCRF